jgi:hypothetical protein
MPPPTRPAGTFSYDPTKSLLPTPDQWSEFTDVGHPGLGESLIPVWGSAREAIADVHDGNYWGAAGNAFLAATDVVPVKALAGTAIKGGFKAAKPGWKAARAALTKEGFAAPGQHVHHWLIPQNGWGRAIPGEIKNAKFNLMPMPDAITHGRIHGPYLGAPQYNAVERFFVGTPKRFQAGVGSVGGHAVAANVDQRGGRK